MQIPRRYTVEGRDPFAAKFQGYVRTARSPSIIDLAELLRKWPGK